MATWAALPLSASRGSMRLDAEFWQPAFVRNEKRLLSQAHTTLGAATLSVRKGVFHILAEDYVDDGIPFYRSANVGEILPRLQDVASISEERHRTEVKTRLTAGDLVISKTARIAASVVLADECNISQDVIGVKVDQNLINPFFLAAFLNTPHGLLQMQRWTQGQVQGHLALPDVRSLLVALPEMHVQESVEAEVLAAVRARAAAEEALDAADRLMAKAVGIDELPPFEVGNIASIDSVFVRANGRMDAEFYSRRFQKLRDRLSVDGTTLGDFASVVRHKWDRGDTGEIKYVEIGDVTTYGTIDPSPVDGTAAPSRASWLLNADEVLTSTVRPIRRLSALVTSEESGAVASSGFAVLQARGVTPQVLLAFLRLRPVCELMDLYTTASMYPSLRVTDLTAVPLPRIDEAVQETVTGLIDEAVGESRAAIQHLEAAKSLVSEIVRTEVND